VALAPVFPEFAAPVLRLKTFNSWPKNLQPCPSHLSEAGFFYTGVNLKFYKHRILTILNLDLFLQEKATELCVFNVVAG
jgi:hypothetical protein